MIFRILLALVVLATAVESAACVVALFHVPKELRDQPFWLCLFLWTSAGLGSVAAIAYDWLSDPRRRMNSDELRSWALAASQAVRDGMPTPAWTLWQNIYTTYRGVWVQLGFVVFMNAIVFHSAAGALSARTLLVTLL